MPRPTYTTAAQKSGRDKTLLTADENVKGVELPAGVQNRRTPPTVTPQGLPVQRSVLSAFNTGPQLPQGDDRVALKRTLKHAEDGQDLEEYRGDFSKGTLTLGKPMADGLQRADKDARDEAEDEREQMDPRADREEFGEREEGSSLEMLLRYVNSPNIAAEPDFTEDMLGRLGAKVVEEYDIDVASRADWSARNERAMKLAKQVVEQKNYPWPKASNIKYPLITHAAIQYNARAYNAIVTPDMVKAKVNGYDKDGSKHARADRVGKAMTWQCLEQMEEWSEEMDQLLLIFSIVGMDFKKTYFDPVLGRNVSERVSAEDLVFNYGAKNFYKCPRKTHKIPLYPYEIREKQLNGIYIDHDFGQSQEDGNNNDPDAQHLFLEQHRLEDLDGDGYPEPYIVTVHHQTRKVVRIVSRFYEDSIEARNAQVARIKPVEYFTKYGFLPNPDGSAHDVGFGLLLGPLNTSINRSINMMFDAAHLANTQGGFFGSGLRMKGGAMRLRPGEYRALPVDGATIRDNIVPLKFDGPNAVLFQLVGFLVEAAHDIASIKDILTGEQSQANMPASTALALIEQGLKTQTSVNQRVHRSLKREFKLLYELNGRYMQPQVYITFLDDDEPTEVLLDDFKGDTLDISPTADPKVLTDMQEIMRAQALLAFAQDPDFDGWKIKQRYLEALGIPDINDLRADPRSKQMAMMQQLMALQVELKSKQADAESKLMKARSGALKDSTGAMKDLADIEAQQQQMQGELDYYASVVEKLSTVIEVMNDARNQSADAGGVPGMAQPAGNPQAPAVSPGLPGANQGQMGQR